MNKKKLAVVLAVMIGIAGCGGGGGSSQATGATPPITTPPAEKNWVTLDSFTVQYSGTILADNVMTRADGSNLLVFAGPNFTNWPNNCPPVGFKALTINSSGKVSDSTSLLNQATTAIHPRALVMADFNGDGIQDMFFANHGCDQDPYPGEHNALFESSGNAFADKSVSLPNLLGFTHTAAAADIRKTGKPDIFVGIVNMTSNPNLADQYKGPNTIGTDVGPYILRNDGNGNFTYDNTSLPTEIAASPHNATGTDHVWATSSAFIDANGDGYPDLVIGGNQIAKNAGSIYLNDGHGGFNTQKIDLPPGLFGTFNTMTVSMIVTDVDGDGKPDLLLSQTQATPVYYGVGKVQVLLNKGIGIFVDATDQFIPNQHLNKGWIQWIHLADINGDGKMDLVLESDNPQDGDVMAYTRSGSAFVPVDRSKLPASVVSLTPLQFGNRIVLASLKKTDAQNVSVNVYEFK